MQTLKTIAALLPLALLLGCNTSKVWYQEGKSFQETQKQLAACRAEKAEAERNRRNSYSMFRQLSGNGDAPTKGLIDIFMKCHGYSLVDKNSLPAGVRGVPQRLSDE